MTLPRFDLSALARPDAPHEPAPTDKFFFPEVRRRGEPAANEFVEASKRWPTPWVKYCGVLHKSFSRSSQKKSDAYWYIVRRMREYGSEKQIILVVRHTVLAELDELIGLLQHERYSKTANEVQDIYDRWSNEANLADALSASRVSEQYKVFYKLWKKEDEKKGQSTLSAALVVSTYILYTLSMLMLVIIAVFVFGFRKSLLSLGSMDVFGWVTYAIIVFSEFLLVAARFFGRWTFCGDQDHVLGDRGERIDALVGMIKNRDAYGNAWQAIVGQTLQLGVSAMAMAGLLLCMEQMMEPDDAKQALAPGWTIIFSFVMFSLCLTALLDVERFGELDAYGAFQLPMELTAFRVLWMTTIVPCVCIGFGVVTNI